jgi:predicted transcriptional regulator
MNPEMENELQHYGMPRRSGRYPWGSGDDPYQRTMDFLGRVEELRGRGMSETEIARELKIVNEKGEPSTGRLRAQIGYANDERKLHQIETMKRLRDKEGMGPTAIGKEMGLSESTVRSMLDPKVEERAKQSKAVVELLKKEVNEKGMIDVGTSVDIELGISTERLNQALYVLESEGYPVYKGGIPQVTNKGKQINQRVLCVPGTEHKEIYDYDKVKTINEYHSHDGGETFDKFVYPKSMDSKRLQICYKEDGGELKVGIVELRRGVDDLSLGNSHYSQVRILVDNDRYIKGMAVYSDDLPDGVDVRFNTNKSKDVAMRDVLKKIKDDPDNPFGSLIKAGGQSYYIDKDGKRQLSLINKRADEGDWEEWQDALPSQFLGKQSLSLAKKQLGLAKADKVAEFESICEITNPTIKKHFLEDFAENCDAAAVNLKAAALPGQKYHVIIPVNTLKDNEVYAPNYKNGEKIALIRYPHGGTFEIPILTVNNKHAAAGKLIGEKSIDAIGINKKIADQLSGADFDGDTVMCIPTHDKSGKVKIANRSPLKDLEGFDPKMEYPEREGMKYMTKRGTQTQMGVISNLITDMTLAGATSDELARAVKHSMVVIDAEKHKLDYKRSEVENNISALKKKYQVTVGPDGKEKIGGASTILSRAKGEVSVIKRQGTPKINKKGEDWYDPSRPEGALIYKNADDAEYTVTKTNKRGETITKTQYKLQQSTRMAETDDAYTLVSKAKHPMELVYAEHANSMKALANQARMEMIKTGNSKYSSTARKTYQAEAKSLDQKLNDALLNATRERAAHRKANAEIAAKKALNPDMTKEDEKKLSQQALSSARSSLGSISRRNRNINITDREWEAIQAGAISESTLRKILNNSDPDKLRERATPRSNNGTLSTAKVNKIKQLSRSNYTLSEIADMMGVSTSTVSKYLKGEA